MNKVIITDMYWHNIYLTLSLQGDAIKDCHFYVTDLKKVYPLEQPVIANPVIKQVYENQGHMYENILIPITDGKRMYNISCNPVSYTHL